MLHKSGNKVVTHYAHIKTKSIKQTLYKNKPPKTKQSKNAINKL